MSSGIVPTGFIFNASQYPGIWVGGEPNGFSNVTHGTGRYLVLTTQGIKDVGDNYILMGSVCMLEKATYRYNLGTMKFYRLDIQALVNQSATWAICEQEGGRLAIPYGESNKQAVAEYGGILPNMNAYINTIIWLDGKRENISSLVWMFNDGKTTNSMSQLNGLKPHEGLTA
jgi:hypothetical protein